MCKQHSRAPGDKGDKNRVGRVSSLKLPSVGNPAPDSHRWFGLQARSTSGQSTFFLSWAGFDFHSTGLPPSLVGRPLHLCTGVFMSTWLKAQVTWPAFWSRVATSADVTLGWPLNLSEAPVPLLHKIYQEDVLHLLRA